MNICPFYSKLWARCLCWHCHCLANDGTWPFCDYPLPVCPAQSSPMWDRGFQGKHPISSSHEDNRINGLNQPNEKNLKLLEVDKFTIISSTLRSVYWSHQVFLLAEYLWKNQRKWTPRCPQVVSKASHQQSVRPSPSHMTGIKRTQYHVSDRQLNQYYALKLTKSMHHLL